MKNGFLLIFSAILFLFGNAATASLQNRQSFDVQLDQAGIRIDGQYQLLRGGSLQWWRLPEAVWRDRIKRFKAAGFNTIDMYVPWNVVEPRDGEFNFQEPNLTGFLALCQELGIYVYFRPGPYITNEMDGGGVPAWLMANSTKKDIGADGKPNLRTYDEDYLHYVQRYFRTLNAVIRPYLASQGGPIVLYAIENEYNWFEVFYQVDKLALYEGTFERPVNTSQITTRYLTALRDMVLADGIDVPITTCPGDGKLSGMGRVPGLVPMPNIYSGLSGGKPEKTVYSLLQKMHDPLTSGGIYMDYPSGTTETDRVPSNIKRMLIAGLDATFAFNIFGTHQDGYRNGMALNIDSVKKLIDFEDKRSIQAKMADIQVGYYHNVIDFNGAVSPSGGHRENYYEFRRDNGFFDTVTPYLAPITHAQRSAIGLANSNPGLTVNHPALGAREGRNYVHYWMQQGDGPAFISLVNESPSDQEIATDAIQFQGERIPRFSTMTVPLKRFDGKPQFGDVDLSNAVIIPFDFPISDIGTLHYTTSEMMWQRSFNEENLLLLHGKSGTQGELALQLPPDMVIVHKDDAIKVAEHANDSLTVTYPHQDLHQLILENRAKKRLRVVITDSATAGRSWLLDDALPHVLIIGADYVDVDSVKRRGNAVEMLFDHDNNRTLSVIAPAASLSTPAIVNAPHYDEATDTTTFNVAETALLPELPDLLTHARTRADQEESEAAYNDRYWTQWSGNPDALERKGIYTGHAWYRSTFTLDREPRENTPLYIQGASDFVGIYVNGHYLSTVAPLGTAIDSGSNKASHAFASLTPYLRKGENTIAFRTEIWGHGSFMFPRGNLFLFGPSIPAVGFDSLKGLQGSAKVGSKRLTQWKVRAGLGGENNAYISPLYDDSPWDSAHAGVALNKGDIRWVRTHFSTHDLPSPEQVQAPIVLALKGQRSKASIYLNGKLIGRWLSDNDWLKRGFWGGATREMWMNTDPDHFPIDYQQLNQNGQNNVLAIAFEDTSHSSEAAGTLTDIALKYATENQRFDDAGQLHRISATKWRTPLKVTW